MGLRVLVVLGFWGFRGFRVQGLRFGVWGGGFPYIIPITPKSS